MFFLNIHIRIKLIMILFIICFVLIIGKVFYIQVFSYNKLKNYANSLWSRNLSTEASRGKIYDRNGIVIADNITTISLVFIPNQIKEKEKTATLIAPILNVSYEVADKINSLYLPGVYLLKESKRSYPYNSMLAHTLCFVGIDNQDLSGLELMHDKYLYTRL